jgi:4-diphosphocytidyl-2-C-methyl-D-erythritol kinase
MVSFPNAKVNLGLNITEKRSDGYHNIESVFYPIAWADMLEVVKSEEQHFQTTGLPIPGDAANNLIIKAFDLLKTEGLMPDAHVNIHLHKILPMGAGIGGGSADGAFMLKLLNEVFELNLSITQLQGYASQLGSDCSFFIENKPMYCFGRGNEFETVNLDLSKKTWVLVNPQIHISTAEAYASIKPQKPEVSIKEIIAQPINTWKDTLVNDFEIGLKDKYPKILEIKDKLYGLGAIYASMTGSGSTVFGIFDKEVECISEMFSECICWQGKGI